MNSKFFDVKKDKQDAIINAALKTFALKGYKDASTDVIVKEAGISKGLLFHYFTSKQGLYDFICDYSTKYMTLELTRAVKKSEKDCFELMSQISLGRVRVMKNYPFMHRFLRSIRNEEDKGDDGGRDLQGGGAVARREKLRHGGGIQMLRHDAGAAA